MSLTIEKWKERIEKAIEQNGPYSHNIIGLALSAIAKEAGNKVANDVIAEMDLEMYGFRAVPEDK